MRTTRIKIVEIPMAVMESEEGYKAPDGWRIVDSQLHFSGTTRVCRVTLAGL